MQKCTKEDTIASHIELHQKNLLHYINAIHLQLEYRECIIKQFDIINVLSSNEFFILLVNVNDVTLRE